MDRLFPITVILIFFVVVNLALDPIPAIPDGCGYGVAYSCYNSEDKVEQAGCEDWCRDVKNKLFNDYGYGSGCRFGNAQRSDGYCRYGKKKMKCRRCDLPEMTACCGTCKRDCNQDVVYLEHD